MLQRLTRKEEKLENGVKSMADRKKKGGETKEGREGKRKEEERKKREDKEILSKLGS